MGTREITLTVKPVIDHYIRGTGAIPEVDIRRAYRQYRDMTWTREMLRPIFNYIVRDPWYVRLWRRFHAKS